MNDAAYRTLEQLHAGLDHIRASPADHGKLEMIVIRPVTNERRVLERCEISAAGGVHGDSWANDCWMKLDDGRPDPQVQICMMNARVIDLIAGSRDRWALAGDNLFVDFDMTCDNLQPGDRLSIGPAMVEISEQPHNGCKKFVSRYGKDALSFVNSPQGKQMRLRGIYAKVIEPGTIRVGDMMKKLQI
jgi:MOSC domain-containing protein YiiM